MNKYQMKGVQVYTGIWIWFGKTIFYIPPDWAVDGGQLDPDLVRTTSGWPYLYKPVIIEFAHSLIGQVGFLASGNLPVIGSYYIFLFILNQPMRQFGHFIRGSFFDYGPINFMNISFTEQLHHPFQSFGSSGKDYQSTDRPVQPVDWVQKYIPRFVIFVGNIFPAIIG